jgi:hypothetical protein
MRLLQNQQETMHLNPRCAKVDTKLATPHVFGVVNNLRSLHALTWGQNQEPF